MKNKLVALCLALCLLPISALAEGAVTANGVAEAKTTYDVVAPFSGVLLPFDWASGDTVAAGETLFTLDTCKVYAPESGTLTAAFAQPGDSADDVVRRYGALAYVEQRCPFLITATTSGAYNDPENKLLHVGETLYLDNQDTDSATGEGRVIAVTATGYLVEVFSGEYELKDSVKLYRDSALTDKACVGKGIAGRIDPVAVLGTGRVLVCAHQAGDAVEKGELLYELALGDADPGVTDALVSAPTDAVVGALRVASGQSVYKGQLLVTLHDVHTMQVVAEVDELDLGRLAVGDSVTLVFDRYPEKTLDGAVAEISRMGVSKQNATYYDVRIDLNTTLSIWPGMNATVFLPGDN